MKITAINPSTNIKLILFSFKKLLILFDFHLKLQFSFYLIDLKSCEKGW